MDILRTFAQVKVQPPSKPEELLETIEKLNQMAEEYELKGQDELDAGEHDEGGHEKRPKKEERKRGPKMHKQEFNLDDEAYPTI